MTTDATTPSPTAPADTADPRTGGHILTAAADTIQQALDHATICHTPDGAPARWYWTPYMGRAATLACSPNPQLHEVNVLKTTDDWAPSPGDATLIGLFDPHTAAALVPVLRAAATQWETVHAERLRHHTAVTAAPVLDIRSTPDGLTATKRSAAGPGRAAAAQAADAAVGIDLLRLARVILTASPAAPAPVQSES